MNKFYTSIIDLPLNKFIDCLVDKNLYALVITGEPSLEELASAWDDILLEYNDAMGDNEGKMHLRLFKEVHTIIGEIGLINASVELMRFRYKKEDADDLNRLTNSKFQFDVADPKKYHQELDRCLARAKYQELNYKIKKAQLDALEEKMNADGSKRKPVDKKYFKDILITLMENSHGIRLVASEMDVYEFCERVRRYGEYLKQLQSQNKK